MLTVRDDQLSVFAALAEQQALNRAVLALRRENEQSDRPLSERDLRDLAEYGLKLAPAFGIADDAGIVQIEIRQNRALDPCVRDPIAGDRLAHAQPSFIERRNDFLDGVRIAVLDPPL